MNYDQAEPLIEVSGLTKIYKRWKSPSSRLGHAVLGRLARSLPKRVGDTVTAKISRLHEDFYALKGVSFKVQKGESFGVIGKNGSGKSTLLQIIAGTLQPSEGNVIVRGRVAALLELGSGFNPEFTGKENVYLNAALLGMKRHEIDERYDRIAAFADIGSFVNEPVKTYSSGMLVRLAFSVAIHADADILIVDEALAVGDVFFQQKCYRKIREIEEAGVTFLFVSHDHVALQNLCDRGIILDRGHKVFEGPADQCAHRYMRQVYAHSPEPGTGDGAEHPRDSSHPTDNSEEQSESPERESTLLAHSILPSAKARHGDRRVELLAATLTDTAGHPVATLPTSADAVLTLLARVNQSIKDPEVAFRLIDRLGNTVFGTCNSSLGQQLGNYEANETLMLKFQITFAVDIGKYTLTLETGKIAEDRPYMGIYFDVIEGVGPIEIFDPEPAKVRPFYGMAQLPCTMEIW